MIRFAAICAALFVPSAAQAQHWIAVRLHPTVAQFSYAYAVTSGRQGGLIRIPLADQEGGLWNGSPESWSNLSPPTRDGEVLGMDGNFQVGDINGRATLWAGTPESAISLSPAVPSVAFAVRGGIQVGTIAPLSSPNHAALWRGTAASLVDLHPIGATESIAYATDGNLQGGYARWEAWHAVLWNGAPQSVVDLGPVGVHSAIQGMAPGIQVGWVSFPGVGYHACVWHGTAESRQDFNASGGQVRFFATTGRVHVGEGALPGSSGATYAVLNFGRPDAWLNLHQFLPPGYSSFSGARAVYQDGPTIYVGGYATSDVSGADEAFLWIGTVDCYANCDGSTTPPLLSVNDFICFLNAFVAGDPLANCDGSTVPPTLNINDFACFINRYAVGCP